MSSKNNPSGFTLIELLIVIAILGVLAAVIMILIDPAELLARSRDAGRINTVTQIGRSIQRYRTTHDNSYPNNLSWGADLLASTEMNSIPSGIPYNTEGVTSCTTNPLPTTNPTFCYNLDETDENGALVFSALESKIKNEYCTDSERAYFVYSTTDSKAGLICSDTDPAPWEAGEMSYLE